jgi:poly(3-hydroxyalkanoate) synthetase
VKSRLSGGGHVAFVVGKSSDDKYLYMLGGKQGAIWFK